MLRPLQQLIDALRQELQQQGELLARLEEMGPLALQLAGAEAGSPVQSQAADLLAAQQERERLQLQLAWAAGQPGACSFDELIPVLPPNYRPLLSALVEETDSLRCRVSLRLREDLCWLDRACEISHRTLGAIAFPAAAAAQDHLSLRLTA
jgi:hypothetical protein